MYSIHISVNGMVLDLKKVSAFNNSIKCIQDFRTKAWIDSCVVGLVLSLLSVFLSPPACILSKPDPVQDCAMVRLR